MLNAYIWILTLYFSLLLINTSYQLKIITPQIVFITKFITSFKTLFKIYFLLGK